MFLKISTSTRSASARSRRLNAPHYGRPILFASTTLLVFGAFMLSRSVKCSERPVNREQAIHATAARWCYDPMSRKLVSKPVPLVETSCLIQIRISRMVEKIAKRNAPGSGTASL
ncbi:hypothetical protein DYBT9623_01815 [Dyadobacter sp. CECT 9623]|uniref:Uncharacterized protein n=2 Tax=Dyadobacter linearis TaxID=2823330 RepID=A0ABM8UNT2_9BACT|nr:hypothetical protein DYBT9623_01815 [Dyadobacter sp. CECT 9623]